MPIMTEKEREVLLTNFKTKKTDPKVSKVVETAFTLVGSALWGSEASVDERKLALWKQPPAIDPAPYNVSMVCWCAPLYIAFKAGIATEKHIKTYNDLILKYFTKMKDAKHNVESNYVAAEEFYGAAKAKEGTGNPGDIVFFFRDKHAQPELVKYAVHYALLLTGNVVASLWEEPHKYKRLQICTIPQLVEACKNPKDSKITVKYNKAPWS